MSLSKVNELTSDDLNCNVFSVYDYSGLSMQELLSQFFIKINEIVQNLNTTTDHVDTSISTFEGVLDYLKGEGLQIEVATKLLTWFNDGTLSTIINETIFNDLNTKIDIEVKGVAREQIKVNGLNKFFKKLNNGQTATIVCLGDSTTQGIGFTNFVDLLRTYLQTTLGYGSLANVINAGIGGDTTEKGLNRLASDVVNKNPDAVIICFGINDTTTFVPTATSMKAYRNIIDYILAWSGNDTDIIVRTCNISRDINKKNDFDTFNTDLKKVCYDYQIQFADYNTYMKNLNFNQDTQNTYFTDSIHPNALGYQLMFDYMIDYIVPSTVKTFKEYGVKKLELTNKNITTSMALTDNINFYGGKYTGGSSVNSIKIKFFGNGFKIGFTKSSSGGKVKITLDGVVIENEYDLYSPTLAWQSIYELNNLDNKEHTIQLDILGAKNVSSTGTNVLIGGFLYTTLTPVVSEVYSNNNTNANVTTVNVNNNRIIKDLVTGVKFQSGFASCDKDGWITLPEPFTNGYNVICTQSGGGGIGSPTYENIYFTGSADYELTRFKPSWASADLKKGINYIAIGV